LIGLNLPNVPDGILTTPLALSEFVEPFGETNLQLLLTPKLGVNDIDVGIGQYPFLPFVL